MAEPSGGPLLAAVAQNRSHGFYVIFVASFVVFLVVALLAQLVAWKWRPWFPGAEGETSLVDAVKASVYTFMSYLT
jgi:light-harvesting complex 1 beta chain